MADSSTILDLINPDQAGHATQANELFDPMSPGAAFGRQATACSALRWGYYGGVLRIANVPTHINNGFVDLTASTTNYVYRDASGVVTTTTSIPGSWPGPLASNNVALYQIVTGTNTVSSWIDYRLAAGEIGNAGAAALESLAVQG